MDLLVLWRIPRNALKCNQFSPLYTGHDDEADSESGEDKLLRRAREDEVMSWKAFPQIARFDSIFKEELLGSKGSNDDSCLKED